MKGKSHLTDLGSEWEYNLITDHKEIGCKGVDWINLAQDRVQWHALVSTVMNLRVP
jgi:hypothetical protein